MTDAKTMRYTKGECVNYSAERAILKTLLHRAEQFCMPPEPSNQDLVLMAICRTLMPWQQKKVLESLGWKEVTQ